MNRHLVAVIAFMASVFAYADADAVEILSAEELASHCVAFPDDVDSVDGQSQTVIKPLARLFRGVPGVSATAVLGNGRVALILDVPGLLRREVEERTGADRRRRREEV